MSQSITKQDYVSIAPLVLFRIGFGIVFAYLCIHDLLHFLPTAKWSSRPLYFHYPLFHWVVAPSEGLAYLMYAVQALLALAIATGYRFRISSALFTTLYLYLFLADRSFYLNHAYLITMLSVMLCCSPAHKAWSLDTHSGRTEGAGLIDARYLYILRAQILIVYFYATLSKLEWDWLNGFPLMLWIPERFQQTPVRDLVCQPIVPLLMSYGGLLIDGFAFIALTLRWRVYTALSALLLFHLLNAYLFILGAFPWMMIASLVLFVEPGAAERALRLFTPWVNAHLRIRRLKSPLPTSLYTVFMLHLMAQCIIPLRPYVYSTHPSWNEVGKPFSWRLKLRDKVGTLEMLVRDKNSSKVAYPALTDHLTPRQQHLITTEPELLLQYAHYLAEYYRAEGMENPEVFATNIASLNNRPLATLVRPEVDLASISFWNSPWEQWITPAPSPTEEPNLRQVMRRHNSCPYFGYRDGRRDWIAPE